MNKREIKFRAWDKKYSIFAPFAHYGKDVVIGIDMRGQIIEDNGDHRNSLVSGRYELMQFTGLKDKNGKDIYEGDRIRCSLGDGLDYYRVFWNEERAGFNPFIIDNNEYGDKVKMETVEVIGNIYEQPNLLKP